MTTSKAGIRAMVDEWLSDFGTFDRFEYDIQGSCLVIDHVDGKLRIPHPEQSSL